MRYIDTPQKINIFEILGNKASFSPHNYKKVIFGGKNSKTVRDFLSSDLVNGEEVGSDAYIRKSYKYFVRNKALQQDSFLLNLSTDSIIPILPSKFVDLKLRQGDLIISKDSNIGETIILDKDYPDHMLSGGLYKLPVDTNKYYLFAFLKHDFFRTQLNFLVSKGATILHAKKLFLDCLIPLPNQKNSDQIITYLEILVRLVVNKEKKIKENEDKIFTIIQKEISSNQVKKDFKYQFPDLQQILLTSRIDAGFYCEDYIKKQFSIRNYTASAGTIEDWGFEIGRGQNLQVSAIGNSIYSEQKKENFYTLVRPTNLSDFGTVTKYEYLGNSRKLSPILEGDIIFSAEGSVGKCVMFANPKERTLTNIHGIVLNKKDHNKTESAFVCCFLRYLRNLGTLDYISVGGQGGSLAMKYWSEVKIAFFPKEKQQEIAKYYYNPVQYKIHDKDLGLLENQDLKLNEEIGILQLDEQIKILKEKIHDVVDTIINGDEVKIDLNFTDSF
jgi:type I restriction enzyme S subunit